MFAFDKAISQRKSTCTLTHTHTPAYTSDIGIVSSLPCKCFPIHRKPVPLPSQLQQLLARFAFPAPHSRHIISAEECAILCNDELLCPPTGKKSCGELLSYGSTYFISCGTIRKTRQISRYFGELLCVCLCVACLCILPHNQTYCNLLYAKVSTMRSLSLSLARPVSISSTTRSTTSRSFKPTHVRRNGAKMVCDFQFSSYFHQTRGRRCFPVDSGKRGTARERRTTVAATQ